MSYFKLLGFDREPFSTSPDPDFLYLSREHDLVLTNLLIELRLKRGLGVILGDIGTGKTTLSRKLVQELSVRNDFILHVVFDPTFESEKEFLFHLAKNYQVPFAQDLNDSTVSEVRDAFEKFVLHKNLEDHKTVVLIIDEAQKLSNKTLEMLRILLNYETNEYKLIQLILFGQLELHTQILKMANFYDRIDFKFTLNPLGFEEAKDMIEFRIRQAGYTDSRYLFLEDAVKEIYYYTKGYPRGIIRICHKCLRALLMSKTRLVVDKELTKEVIGKDAKSTWSETTVPLKKNY